MAEWTAHTASSNSSTSSSAKATAAAETTTSAASGHPTSGHPSLSSSVRRLAGRKEGGELVKNTVATTSGGEFRNL